MGRADRRMRCRDKVARTSTNAGGDCMQDVVVIGGGPTGLTAAMKFAHAGASVTVLERDPAAMPDSPTDAWEQWERRAVPQFRQVHYLQPAGRWALEQHLPSVIDELRDVGAIELHADVIFRAPTPDPDPDPRYSTLTTSRRPVLELAFARAATKTPGVEIRRGAAVEALVTGAAGRCRCAAHHGRTSRRRRDAVGRPRRRRVRSTLGDRADDR